MSSSLLFNLNFLNHEIFNPEYNHNQIPAYMFSVYYLLTQIQNELLVINPRKSVDKYIFSPVYYIVSTNMADDIMYNGNDNELQQINPSGLDCAL